MTVSSLYIHLPWCIRKCPYCDFNSHVAPQQLPEQDYIEALLQDFIKQCEQYSPQALQTIFIGGGTPSLFTPTAIATLLDGLAKRVGFAPNIEITLEANPGTFEAQRFQGFANAGVNRLSIGIQSFQDDKLQALGRIHSANEAKVVLANCRDAGFDNFNIDIMHGLPGQSLKDAIFDLETALSFQPPHLSWYQLTIEPNTIFYKRKPQLPNENCLADIEAQGKALIAANGLTQYEVSAYARCERQAQHNLNYWRFGDYLAIGAGAHGKITSADGTVQRYWQHRLPKDYLDAEKPFTAKTQTVTPSELAFEYMLNKLRLYEAVEFAHFNQATKLDINALHDTLSRAQQRGLLQQTTNSFSLTALGRQYLNDVVAMFMP